MAINFFYEEIEKQDFNAEKVINWIKKVAKTKEFDVSDINYIFCNDNYILEINKQYLNHDYFTDIITFDYTEANVIAGDLFISIDTVNKNAEYYNSKDTELYRVIIHGILHLMGYKDKTENDAAEMRQNEDEALKLLEL